MTDHDSAHADAASTPAAPKSVSVWAGVSLILGLAAMATFTIDNVGGLVAIVGIVCGHVGRRESKAGLKAGGSLALSGLILCYFLLVLGIVARFAEARRS